ncbi:hypothetical protein, partial [Pseudomonas viridiflava]|uniref:hypothetical protein n=1 Tax=Pseudomonas viridiflava TaxID=33069 RepID=UPI00197F2937
FPRCTSANTLALLLMLCTWQNGTTVIRRIYISPFIVLPERASRQLPNGYSTHGQVLVGKLALPDI